MNDIHHLLIGLPASGKSTFALQLAKVDRRYIVISTDAIRAELFGNEAVQGNWAEVEAEVLRRVELAVQEGKWVIYDATNFKRAHRLDWLEKAAAVGAEKWMAWYLQVPVETCLQRNQKRSRQVPEGVILAMAASLKAFPPDYGEGLVAIEKIALALTPEEIRARIALGRDSFSKPKKRKQAKDLQYPSSSK